MTIRTEVLDELLSKVDSSAELLTPDGLLKQLTKALIERALDAERTVHLGYDKHDPNGRNSGNSRNGTTPKTLHTEMGDIDLNVPRDRIGTFEPQLIPKGSTMLEGLTERIIALYGSGVTVRDIQAHLRDIYGVAVSPDLISQVTDAVLDELREWQNRPLDPVYPIVFIDALVAKVRDEGTVQNKSAYMAIGVNSDGEKENLGIWIDTTEGAKFWLRIFNDLKARGLADVLVLCCDGLCGLPEAAEVVWPAVWVQTCIVHMIRNSLRYVSHLDRKAVASDLKAIYRAETEQAAADALEAFEDKWGKKYPPIPKMWHDHWERITPFLAFPPEIRKVIYTTNAIESQNYQMRKVTKNRGHFPNDDALLKLLYLTVRNIEKNRRKLTPHWREALNQFEIYFPGRLDRTIRT